MRYILFNILFLLAMLFTSASAQEQEQLFSIQHFGVEDGLTDRDVHAINQDEKGFIWIGTGNGLVRFDGVNFKSVEKDALFSGVISKIGKDEKGRLYIKTNHGGVVPFDPIDETISKMFSDSSSFWKRVELLNNSKPGTIYLKTEEGGIHYINDQDQLVHCYSGEYVKEQQVKRSDRGTFLHSDYKTEMLIERNSNGELLRQEKVDAWSSRIYTEVDNRYIFHVDPVFLDSVAKKGFLIRTDKKLLFKRISLKKNGTPLDVVGEYSNASGLRILMTKDNEGNTCLNANGHVLFFDEKGDCVTYIDKALFAEKANGMSGGVNHLFFDSSNRLWIATGNGIFLVQRKKNLFHNYYANGKNFSMRGIIELPNGDILANSYKGTKVFDKKSKEEILSAPIIGGGVAIVKGPNDSILIGYHGPGIGITSSKEIVINTKKVSPTVGFGAFCPLYDTINKQIYVGTSKGLFYQPVKGSTFIPYDKLNGYSEIPKLHIPHVYQNKEGIWLATKNNLYLLDPKKGVIDHIVLPYKSLKHIHEDEQGDFWIATAGGGLIHWNRKTNEKRQFTTADGLSHNVTYASYSDQNGFLWVSSNNGLMRIEKATNEIVTFHEEDGIAHEEFNSYSHYQGKDGRLYFGGLNGITSFHPDDVKPTINEAPLLLTSFHKYDPETGEMRDRKNDLLEKMEITLNPEDRSFTIGFTLLDYFAKPHLYAWRINGLYDDWTYQEENKIRINSLDYGSYTLEVKAKGEGGNWAVNQLSIPIKVLKPFYLSWIFILACIFASLLSFFSIAYIRFKRLIKEEEKLQRIVEERTTALSERTNELSEKNKELEELNQFKDKIYAIIAHDLRGPAFGLQDVGSKINYLIETNQLERLKSYGNSVDESLIVLNRMLDNLLKWANQNLKNISIKPQLLEIEPLLDQVLTELNVLVQQKSISITKEIVAPKQVYADKQTVLAIVRNLISNAIKFTPSKGQIKIKVLEDRKAMRIEVIDNGVGILSERLPSIFKMKDEKSTVGTNGENGTGLGLALSKELAELNNGDIEVVSAVNKGSTFSLVLPVDSHS